MMKNTIRVMSCGLAVAAATATGVATVNAQTLEFTAGGVGGGWYNMASGLSALVQETSPEVTLRTVPGGGVSNPSKIDQGISQLGFIQSIFGVAARNGAGPFEEIGAHEDVRLVLHGLANNYLHLISQAGDDATMREILTTEGRDIGIAPAGSTDEYSFRFAMEFFGTNYEERRDAGLIMNAGYLDLASAFRDGQIDYIFVLLGLPGSMVVDASRGRDAQLVAFDEELRQDLSATWGYAQDVIPAGTYDLNGETDVPVLVTSTSLYANADVSEDTIYEIVKAICEAPAERLASIAAAMGTFSCANAAGDGIVPLHPGAERYLSEQGYL